MSGGSKVGVLATALPNLHSVRNSTAFGALVAACFAAAVPASAQTEQASEAQSDSSGDIVIAHPRSPRMVFQPELVELPEVEVDEAQPEQSDRGNRIIDETVDFEADELAYNSQTDTVIASGNVILRSADRSVRADQVVWTRATGSIVATGNVRFVDERGNQLFTESVELTDKFEAGAMDELLLALRAGGRLAARSAARGEDGTVMLSDAAYTACAVADPEGCSINPSWRVTADRVTFDPEDNRIRFSGAVLELFGARILPLPGLSLRTDGSGESGFLVPDIRISESNGTEVSGRYLFRFDSDHDLTLGAYVYTEVAPMVSAEWRHLTKAGAYQITGYATHSSRINPSGATVSEEVFRGYLNANGRFQFSPEWSFTTSIRLASDRTFLRRYDLSRDDRLRSTFNIERINRDSYLSLAGWATQTLRINADQGQVPLALPAFDFRQRLEDPVVGGEIELQVNTLSLVRNDGQDTQRAFAGAKWNLRRLTGFGQVVTLSGLARGDIYHTDNTLATTTALYRGDEGWTARGIATAAIDIEWPFVGEAFGGTQVLTPRVQLVASPKIENLAVPNEDARAIDLEDSNLFALNRFPGYDRVEDGVRLTWGLDWELQRPGWRIKTNVGQSYRFDNARDILPDGTGLSDRLSDFVGRTEVRYRDFLKFTHRFRLDKDDLAIRRNEVDATIGSRRTYVELGYLRLDRDIQDVEDLQDREELRAAARIAFDDNWSMFGSGVFNLTNTDEDPTFSPDGFEPIRTRLGVAYQDDCIEFGLTWRRDYITAGDAERGNTFQIFFSLSNLGFR